MFSHHLLFYYGEVFTAIFVAVGYILLHQDSLYRKKAQRYFVKRCAYVFGCQAYGLMPSSNSLLRAVGG